VKRFVKKLGVRFEILINEDGVATQWRVQHTPHIVLFDKDGGVISVGDELPIGKIHSIMERS